MMLNIYSYAAGLNQTVVASKKPLQMIDVRSLPDPEGLGIGLDGRDEEVQSWIREQDPNAWIAVMGIAIQAMNDDFDIAFASYAGKNRSVAVAEVFKRIAISLGHPAQVHHLGLEEILGKIEKTISESYRPEAIMIQTNRHIRVLMKVLNISEIAAASVASRMMDHNVFMVDGEDLELFHKLKEL
jgi:hypothetical protein